jgi:hypothetical protein
LIFMWSSFSLAFCVWFHKYHVLNLWYAACALKKKHFNCFFQKKLLMNLLVDQMATRFILWNSHSIRQLLCEVFYSSQSFVLVAYLIWFNFIICYMRILFILLVILNILQLGRRLFTHLKVYKGAEHPHVAQKPVPLPIRDKRIQKTD